MSRKEEEAYRRITHGYRPLMYGRSSLSADVMCGWRVLSFTCYFLIADNVPVIKQNADRPWKTLSEKRSPVRDI